MFIIIGVGLHILVDTELEKDERENTANKMLTYPIVKPWGSKRLREDILMFNPVYEPLLSLFFCSFKRRAIRFSFRYGSLAN